MKKRYLSLSAALLLGAMNAMAVPANPKPGILTQPDGTTITARLHGDEFHNFTTTIDGYTIMQDNSGRWCYAQLNNDGVLQPGTVIARDEAARTQAELDYLKTLPLGLQPQQTQAQAELQANYRRMIAPGTRGLYDYKKFKGLVLLVNSNDRSFTQPNIQSVFNDIINAPGYTGFTPNGATTKQEYTGSVRDYFHDNSHGLFTPSFDVVGPVTVPYSQYDMQQTANARSIVAAACAAADSQVDFSKYDTDGDGVVDMFYIIFAGFGSNNTGNDSRLVWPHASTMPGNVLDGVKLGRYACSTELYGYSLFYCVDGIGTICHEFSHVLGLMDEYDTDYAGSGGQSVDPGAWSVMAGGSYNNYARTPVGYSLMQRYQSGFAVPQLITGDGEYTIVDIDESNAGYRINTSNPKEYFLLENRRKVGNKWNAYLPGEGMLIYRVDSTSTTPWSQNTINADPTHNYYEMVRACPKGSGLGISDSAGDPFPGSGGITEIGPYTNPGLLSWGDRYTVEIGLSNINEDENGVITFKSTKTTSSFDLEDFEAMTTNSSSDKNVPGKYCNWSFTKGGVYTPPAGMCNGIRAAGLLKGGTLESSEVDDIESLSMRLFNSASRNCNVRVQYWDANINGWVILKDVTGQSGTTLAANSATTLRFNIPENLRKNFRMQLKVNTGSDTDRLYVDDVHMRGIKTVVGSVTTSGNLPLTYTLSSGGALSVYSDSPFVTLYDFAGRRIATQRTVDGIATLTLPAHGTFIVTDSRSSLKLVY